MTQVICKLKTGVGLCEMNFQDYLSGKQEGAKDKTVSLYP